MNNLAFLSDLSVIIFNLIIYFYIIPLKKNTIINKTIIIFGCIIMITAYSVSTLIFNIGAGLSSFFTLSIPSFLLFLCFAKYKDARFVVTFCFIDTITLIIAFFARYIEFILGASDTLIPVCVTAIALMALIFSGKKFLKTYKYLIENVKNCWGELAVSSLFIYVLLILFSSYPKPIVERVEYATPYLFLCISTLAFYFVFVKSIFKTKNIEEQNEQLKQQIELYMLAYTDSLTGVGNKTLFNKTISNINDGVYKYTNICVIVLDLNRLKFVNDTYGHISGDKSLLCFAGACKKVFNNNSSMIFRFGGDEFCIFCFDKKQNDIENLLNQLQCEFEKDKPYPEISFSYGFDFFDGSTALDFEQIFKNADNKMYENKKLFYENEHI